MTSLPRSLRYYLSRMSVSVQRMKIRAQSQASAGLGDVIVFDLPNSICDLDSLTLGFNLTTTVSDLTTKWCRLSQPGTDSLVESIQVDSNGFMIDSGVPVTNRLSSTWSDWQIGEDKTNFRAIVQGLNKKTPVAGNVHTADPMHITHFPGFLGSVQPRKFDVTNCPLRVYIKLAGKGAFMTNDTASTVSLGNIHAYINVLDINDSGLYLESVQKLMEQAPLQCPFEKYYYSQGAAILTGGEDEQILNLSTQSLDYLMGVFIDNTAFTSPSSVADLDQAGTNVKSAYFKQGLPDSCTLNWSRFAVNNVRYPSMDATPADAFCQTQLAWGLLNDTTGGSAGFLKSLNDYVQKSFCHIVPFSFPGAEGDLRLVSGLNTLGNTTQSSWTTNIDNSDGTGQKSYRKLLVAKTTPTLLVAPFRQVSVAY